MEGCVEDCDLGHCGQESLDGTDTEEVGRVVEGSQLAEALNALHHLVIDQAGLGEELTAVSHAVTYGLYLVQGLEHTALWVCKQLEHRFDALGMVGHGLVDYNLVPTGRTVGHLTHFQTDSFYKALSKKGIIVGVLHVEDLILQRRASAVDYQYNHSFAILLKIIQSILQS